MQTTAAITLHSYWTERRGGRPAPLRSEIEPAHLATILPDVFILESDRRGPRIRLAGTRFCAQFGRELKGCAFAELFTMAGRERVLRAADRVLKDQMPVVLTAHAEGADRDTTVVEMVLLPLASRERTVDRILGAFAPFANQRMPLAAFRHMMLGNLAVVRDHPVADDNAIHAPASLTIARPAEAGGTMQRVLHLRIFDGGKR